MWQGVEQGYVPALQSVVTRLLVSLQLQSLCMYAIFACLISWLNVLASQLSNISGPAICFYVLCRQEWRDGRRTSLSCEHRHPQLALGRA